jgi:hypothetical protein
MPDLHQLCEDLLRTNRSVRFTATGASMRPVIREGDVVTIEPCAGERRRAGDIVLYSTPRGLTLHRVLRLEESLLVVRGDALDSQGELVPATAVLGCLVSVCRAGRAVPIRAPVGLRLRRLARKALGLEPGDAGHIPGGARASAP